MIDLQNFYMEKEESGQGVTDPEDAQRFFDDFADIEDFLDN